MTQISPDARSVNKPSLLTSLFKKTRDSFSELWPHTVVCMFGIRLFFACRRWNRSPVPFFSPHFFTYLCSLCAFVSDSFGVFWFPRRPLALSPLLSYCGLAVTVQCILLTHSLKEGPLCRSPAGWASAYRREKLKQYLSLLAFLFFYWGNPEHTGWTRSATSEQDNHWQCIPLWCYCEQLQC